MKLPNAENAVVEQKIDKLVYELYDLNRDKIAIVEEGTQKAKSE
jgi:hypothetical protein